MGERESTGGLVALGAVGVAVCCGLPLLLSAGALGVLAGIVLGGWLVIGAGVAVAATGLWRLVRQPRPSPHQAPTSQPDRIHR